MVVWKAVSTSVEMTEALGEAMGRVSVSGDILTLDGDLGAGKTAFTRGFSRGMGLRSRVTSPTFTIVNEYSDKDGVPKLFHFDTYRLGNSDDFYDAGLDEYFSRGGVCVIEWGKVIEDALPSDRIRMKIAGNGDEREITFSIAEKDLARMKTVREEMEKGGMRFEDIGV